MTKALTYILIFLIKDLKLQERCRNYNDSWENTEKLLHEEAEKGESNPIFWLAVENIAKAIKEFTR